MLSVSPSCGISNNFQIKKISNKGASKICTKILATFMIMFLFLSYMTCLSAVYLL